MMIMMIDNNYEILIFSAFVLLDPDYTFFQPLLNVLIAMVKTDGVALRSGSGGKYNTNRPKGKMDSIQVK